MTNWDPQIASVTSAGYNAAIYNEADGAPYTTDNLQMTKDEVKTACKAIQQGPAVCSKAGVHGEQFMVLRNDEEMCYFKKTGKGGGCFGKTNSLVVAGTYAEGQQPGELNKKVGDVVRHLKNSGY